MNRDQIIKAALVLTGKVDPEEPLSALEVVDGAAALNNLLALWSEAGVAVWKHDTVSKVLVAGQASYTIGTGGDIDRGLPLGVLHALLRVVATNADTPLHRCTEAEWTWAVESKAAAGTPRYYRYFPALTLGVLHLAPVYASTDRAVVLTVQDPVTDFATGASAADLPAAWDDPMIYGLAGAVGAGYGVPAAQCQAWEARAMQMAQALKPKTY